MGRGIRQGGLGMVSAALAAGGLPASAAVVYVDAAATGAGNGSSWANAFTDLGSAINAAGAGDEIWVARGMYRPAGPGGAREASFAVKSGVALYGGFAGHEALREERDWAANPTILSGDLNGDDGPNFQNTTDNVYHVVVALDVSGDAALDGFFVSGGRADGPGEGQTPASGDRGAALSVFGGGIRVEHCTLENNWGLELGAVNDDSGSTFADCTFRGNHSEHSAAGLFVSGGATTVQGCGFAGNTAPLDGGGIACTTSAALTVTSCVFTSNQADRGAGIFLDEGATADIEDCTFTQNNAHTGGGGVFSLHASPTVFGCVFTGNIAGVSVTGGGGGGGGSGGGGVWFSGGAGFVSDCGFYSNEASFGGGVYNNEESAATVAGCLFDNNHASEAGGVYALTSSVTVAGCLFRHNTATGGIFPVGGAVSSYFSNTVVRGSTFVGNAADLGGGAEYCEGEAPVISGCQFIANRATLAPQGWGGAIMNGYNARTLIRESAFIGNSANRGGAVFNFFLSGPFISNCTMVDNSAAEAGGGVYTFMRATAAVVNSVLRLNLPDQIGGPGTAVAYSCVQGWIGGVGNTASDPMFTRLPSPGPDGEWGTSDDDFGDLTPRAGSPCIDAGNSGILQPGEDFDLAGMPRRHDDPGSPDTGTGGAPAVDMGAYEFQGTSCYANCDGSTQAPVLNINDFVCFQARFAAGDPGANCDGSTAAPILNINDFVCFQARFAAGCP